jgi:hypothetical protein
VFKYAEAVFKFKELNTAAQQRGAVVQGRSLPATVSFIVWFIFFALSTKRIFFDRAIIFLQRLSNPKQI